MPQNGGFSMCFKVNGRVAELVNFAHEEGIDLPMAPEVIATLEGQGHVVDLLTGDVIVNGADEPLPLGLLRMEFNRLRTELKGSN
jgi:hypothetical protein